MVVVTLLFLCPCSIAQQRFNADSYFRDRIQLSEAEIKSIHDGTPVGRIIPSENKSEIAVFGAVFVKSSPEEYVKLAMDTGRLKSVPGYLAVGRFSTPPKLSDLQGFTLEPDDVSSLKRCQPRNCDVQLDARAMAAFQQAANSGPDADNKVNILAQQKALQLLNRYATIGNAALGQYEDKDTPVQVAQAFASLLNRSSSLPLYAPKLREYLLQYPRVELPGSQSFFYWEKVDFGLKPTLRIVQAVSYKTSSNSDALRIVVNKQLYASHYFQTAIDVSVCAPAPEKGGFYLITVKGSKQAGLTGAKGLVLRKTIEGKTESSIVKALAYLKAELEKRGTPQK